MHCRGRATAVRAGSSTPPSSTRALGSRIPGVVVRSGVSIGRRSLADTDYPHSLFDRVYPRSTQPRTRGPALPARREDSKPACLAGRRESRPGPEPLGSQSSRMLVAVAMAGSGTAASVAYEAASFSTRMTRSRYSTARTNPIVVVNRTTESTRPNLLIRCAVGPTATRYAPELHHPEGGRRPSRRPSWKYRNR